MPPPQATRDFYSEVQRYELMLVAAGRRLWRRMSPEAMDTSWAQIRPQMVLFTAGAQLTAARAATEYVPAVLEEQGIVVEPLVTVSPAAFSGVASDGRSLTGLLDGAVVASKRAVTRGLDGGDALLNGQKWLEQALQTAVADAARDATAASIVARPNIGWARMVNPPCCSRCAVLAGRVYQWNQGFARHPQCDCLHIPTTLANADTYLSDPGELVKRGLITDLTKAQRERIADGDNLVQVLNASRDRWRAQMTADRRADRYAGYTDAQRRAADRRAGRRTANGLNVPEGWGPRGNNPPPVGTTIHELMARLTSQVEAASAMRAAGIAR